MNQKTLQKLEYYKIIDQLETHASSPLGKFLCKRLVPRTNLQIVTEEQNQTAAAFSYIVKKGRLSFSGCYGVEDSLKRLEIGGALSCNELLRICKGLEVAQRAKVYVRKERDDEQENCLDSLFEQLQTNQTLTTEIRRCILDENEISDDASSNLRQIRRSISNMNDRVHQTLQGLLNGSMRSYLQDALITMRGDRYCLPVKAEYKNQVPGMVHDQSSSGSTLFIEPMAVLKLNNDLRELYGKEEREIEIILAALSEKVASFITEIRTNHQILGELDFIFAKGALALSMNASMPIYNEEGRLHIREGRHPLLPSKSVVPITVSLGDQFNLLIITGPNTGGKTVSLKTVGLFTLLGQAGLHIPALDRSELSIFEEVYADIGDEQSIEQSLSTFSSHMTNIVSFLKTVDSRSLVLFDELGAGTDPTEGAALATSILNYLHERKIRTMATTHYSELKVFALSTPGVENACCEFDVNTLRPTYRLLIGIPGKSNAFAISGKLGLPENIIQSAKELVSSQDASFEDVISDLETRRKTIEQEHAEIISLKQEVEKLKNSLEKQKTNVEDQKKKLLQEANEKANLILRDAKEVADKTIKQLRKSGEGSISLAELERERETLRQNITKTQSDLAIPKAKVKKVQNVSDFKPGESVKVHSLNLTGIVSTKPDSKGNLFVQMGILRSQVHISDLELIEEPETLTEIQRKKSGYGGGNLNKALTIKSEINLIGKNVEEAIRLLDKYLDDAYLAHMNSVRIVHGKGTGALRNGVHNYLRKHPHFSTFRAGEFGEGDAGVTIAEVKN